MKLTDIFLSAIAAVALTSCSAVYDDLDPCPQGVDMTLTFTRNMNWEDQYDTRVHCAKIRLYDQKGNFFGEYDVDGNMANLELPVGKYHAIVYGGMSCENASFDFSHSAADAHHYSALETFIKGTRSPESTLQLHSQFHGTGDFEVKWDDLRHREHTIDLTHNVNNFKILLSYSDASEIKPEEYEVTITADNAVTDHSNNVVKQGEDVTYHPYAEGEIADGKKVDGTPAPNAYLDLSIGRLTTDSNATLHVVRKEDGASMLEIRLVDVLEEIMGKDSKATSLQDYLDRQDAWTLEFTIDPKPSFTTIKVNDWLVVINKWDL
ncbi:MAG: FimB/Mfa2 family fimbrial subunit [Muribaculaceae bacterium]|nr:FimB/Mfa2 family fimbrial subunit [Muribaculaceae bacterium]